MDKRSKELLSFIREASSDQHVGAWIFTNFHEIDQENLEEVAKAIHNMQITQPDLLNKFDIAVSIYRLMNNHVRLKDDLLEALEGLRSSFSARSYYILQLILSADPEKMFSPLQEFHTSIDEQFWEDWECFVRSLPKDSELDNHARNLLIHFRQIVKDPQLSQKWLIAQALDAFESGNNFVYYAAQFDEDTLQQLDELISTMEKVADEADMNLICEFRNAVKGQVEVKNMFSWLPSDETRLSYFDRELRFFRELKEADPSVIDLIQMQAEYSEMYGLQVDAEFIDILKELIERDYKLEEEAFLGGALFSAYMTNGSKFLVYAIEEIGGKFTEERLSNICDQIMEFGELFRYPRLADAIIDELKSNSARYILASKIIQRDKLDALQHGIDVLHQRVWKSIPEDLTFEFIRYAEAYADLGYQKIPQKLLAFSLILVDERPPSYELAVVYQKAGQVYTSLGLSSIALRLYEKAMELLADIIRDPAIPYTNLSLNEAHKEDFNFMLYTYPLELYLSKALTLANLGLFEEAERSLEDATRYAKRLDLTSEEQVKLLQGHWNTVHDTNSQYPKNILHTFLDSLLVSIRAQQGTHVSNWNELSDNIGRFFSGFRPESAKAEMCSGGEALTNTLRFLDANVLLIQGELEKAGAYALSVAKRPQPLTDLRAILCVLANIEIEQANFLNARYYLDVCMDVQPTQYYFSQKEALSFLNAKRRLVKHSDAKEEAQALSSSLLTNSTLGYWLDLPTDDIGQVNHPYIEAQVLFLKARIDFKQGSYEDALQNFEQAYPSYTEIQAYNARLGFLIKFGRLSLLLGQENLFSEITLELQRLYEKPTIFPILRESIANAVYLLYVAESRDLEGYQEVMRRYEAEPDISSLHMNLLDLNIQQFQGQQYLKIALLSKGKDQEVFEQALIKASEHWMKCFGAQSQDFAFPSDFLSGVDTLIALGNDKVVAALGLVFLSHSEWSSIVQNRLHADPQFFATHYISNTWGVLGVGLFLARHKHEMGTAVAEEVIEALITAVFEVTDHCLPNADHERWQFYLAKARVLRFLGYTEIAIDYYRKTVEIIEGLRNRLSNQEYRIGFVKNLEETLKEYLLFGYEQAIIDSIDMLHIVERSRSRSFLDILENRETGFIKDVDDELLARIKDLQTQIQEARKESGYFDTPEIRLDQMKLDDLWEQVRDLRPEYFDLLQAEPVEIRDIRCLLSI